MARNTATEVLDLLDDDDGDDDGLDEPMCDGSDQSNRNRPNFTRFICSGSGRVFQYGCHEAGLRVGV